MQLPPNLRVYLPAIVDLAVITLLVLLDCRDLVYKTLWLGANDSFSFRSGSSSVLNTNPLVPSKRPPAAEDWMGPSTIISSNESIPVAKSTSGWVSFLARCDTIQAFCNSDGFFLSALATNCQIDPNTTWSRAVFTSSIRLDSMVWTSCQLLPVKHRPTICYEEIASTFLERYHLSYPELLTTLVSPVKSSQTDQFLRFLEMVADSLEIAHRMVCVEVIRFEVNTWQQPFAFGCGSANVFRSEFIVHDRFQSLIYGKSWLTMDALRVAGMEFSIRQNGRANYMLTDESSTAATPTPDTIRLTSSNSVNFSSFGMFYVVLLVIDGMLLVLNLWSSVEIFLQFMVPECKSVTQMMRKSHVSSVVRDSSAPTRAVPTSFRASNAPTRDQLPCSDSSFAAQPKPQAWTSSTSIGNYHNLYFSSFSRSLFRSTIIAVLTVVTQGLSWFIILPNSVIWVWSDSNAQKLQAYQTSIRQWVLLVLVIHALWDFLVLINERLAYQIVRRTYLTTIDIIAVIAVVSVAHRQTVFKICEIKWDLEHQRINDVDTFPGYIAHGNSFLVDNFHANSTPHTIVWTIYHPLMVILGSSVLLCIAVAVLKFVWFSISAWSSPTSLTRVSAEDHSAQCRNRSGSYRRLPMEIMVDSPIRARSLIRNDLLLEQMQDNELQIPASIYADFGVRINSDGYFRSRRGFAGCIKPLWHREDLQYFTSVSEVQQADRIEPGAHTKSNHSLVRL